MLKPLWIVINGRGIGGFTGSHSECVAWIKWFGRSKGTGPYTIDEC